MVTRLRAHAITGHLRWRCADRDRFEGCDSPILRSNRTAGLKNEIECTYVAKVRSACKVCKREINADWARTSRQIATGLAVIRTREDKNIEIHHQVIAVE